VTYPAGTSIAEIILPGFISRGLLYSNVNSWESSRLRDSYAHLVIWGSSATSNDDDSSWDVRAAIQTNSSPDPALDEVVMLPLFCSMDAPIAETIVSQMNSPEVLFNWVPTFQGLMYYGALTPVVHDPEQELAMLLNTMAMVYGGNNMLLSSPALNADQTQGCIITATRIPLGVDCGRNVDWSKLIIGLLCLKNSV
jgi:hypothetical protein